VFSLEEGGPNPPLEPTAEKRGGSAANRWADACTERCLAVHCPHDGARKVSRSGSPGTSDKNIEFDSLCDLLKRFGFVERIRGDHHIFTKDSVTEILNLQPRGHQAKAYQVKQVRKVILQYKLAGEADAK
jgi:hypothetical protein